jgi:hypothetical protein
MTLGPTWLFSFLRDWIFFPFTAPSKTPLMFVVAQGVGLDDARIDSGLMSHAHVKVRYGSTRTQKYVSGDTY